MHSSCQNKLFIPVVLIVLHFVPINYHPTVLENQGAKNTRGSGSQCLLGIGFHITAHFHNYAFSTLVAQSWSKEVEENRIRNNCQPTGDTQAHAIRCAAFKGAQRCWQMSLQSHSVICKRSQCTLADSWSLEKGKYCDPLREGQKGSVILSANQLNLSLQKGYAANPPWKL